MSDDEISLSMTVPADPDGFLRRECPTCEVEFKWQTAQGDEDPEPGPDEGYFCPYCAIQAPSDSWWTRAQLDAAKAIALREVLGPSIDKLRRSADRASGGFLSVSVDAELPELPGDNAEDDGMRRVDFACHDEPVKVLEDWQRPVHCPVCGLQS